MAGFRKDFGSLMAEELGFTKVVVLVDDLDRCMPAATVATLEAIKLFLSVPKMAFVLVSRVKIPGRARFLRILTIKGV